MPIPSITSVGVSAKAPIILGQTRFKELKVSSATGTPTISRALPIKISSGNDLKTGTGDIVLDWTNITDKSDIVVRDEKNNLLDYYFESFDATSETAVIWVYRDWVQDGTVQAKIIYGNGSSDKSTITSNIFDKETNLISGFLLNEVSGNALDVTSNNNDGTLSGTITRNVSGKVGTAYDFPSLNDGAIDVPNIGTPINTSNKFTIIYWINYNQFDDYKVAYGRGSNRFWTEPYRNSTTGVSISFNDTTGAQRLLESAYILNNTNFWYFITYTWDGRYLKAYVGPDEKGSFDTGGVSVSLPSSHFIASYNNSNYVDASMDNIFVYDTNIPANEISVIYNATKDNPTFFYQGSASPVDEVDLLLREAVVWLDASNISATDGSQITIWPETNNNNDFIENTTITTPVFRANAVNGLPAVDFGGGNVTLESNISELNNTNPYTVIFVGIDGASGGSAGQYGGISRHTSWDYGNHLVGWQTTAINTDGTRSTNNNQTGDNFIRTDINRTNNNECDLYNNGTFYHTLTYSNWAARETWRLATRGNNHYYDGKIAEVLIFDRELSDNDRNLIENHLKNKYNIT